MLYILSVFKQSNSFLRKHNIRSSSLLSLSSSSSSSSSSYSLLSPCTKLPGTGPKTAELLENLGIKKVSDLLFHLPTNIIDRGQFIDKISDINIEDNNIVTLKLKTEKINEVLKGNIPCSVICSDSVGDKIKIIFFLKGNYWLWQSIKNSFMEGDVVISGKIVIDSYSKKYQIVNPDIVKPLSKIDKTNNCFSVEAVYPLTNGISSSKLKKMIEEALKIAEEELKNDWMDSSLLKKNNWPSLLNSLKYLHSPKTLDCLKITNKAYERLAFDEILCLYLNQLRNNKDKEEKEKKDSKYMLAGEKVLTKELEKQLPFTLTKSQRTSINDIFEDVADDRRMMRLVQGDVGSGKTIVAIMAMLRSVESGKQACLLAPTEILANQHYSTITSLLTLIEDAAMNFNKKTKGVGRPCIARLITGSTKPKERDEILNNLKEGSIDILVGTHSLLGEKVIDSLKNLGLAVIDEEQRFGVNQRDILAKKTNVIFTSATPIPRSLMLLLQEDYSISTLLEKPPAKRPTQTVLIGVSLSEKIIERIKANLPYGSKIFWITPCLNPSPTMPGSSAMERINQLSSMFPGKVALLHGKMSSDEKKSIMANFSASDTPFQILVATSVVEVGIDVPDASICVIDHAENFGLSQLHQIRGRVGRGAAPPNERLKECYCVLLFNDHQLSSEDKSITDIDIYKAKAAEAQSKLQILVNSNDGFEIAEADFRIRGPGDVFGVRQHGFNMYKFAQVNEHTQLFADARIVAKNLDTGLLNVNDQQKGTLKILRQMFTVEEETNVTPSIEKVKKAKEIKKITSEVVVTGTANSLNSKLFRLEDHILILFDLETTGLNFSLGHRIIQIAAKVMLEDKEIFNAYVLPSGSTVSNEIAKLTGITQEFLNTNGMPIEDALRKFNDWITYLQETKYPNKKIVLGGHNAKLFDFPFLKSEMQNLPTSKYITLSGITCFDSLSVLKDKRIWDNYGKKPVNFKLVTIHKHLMNSDFNAHDARSDVIALENCLVKVNFQSVVQDHLFIFT